MFIFIKIDKQNTIFSKLIIKKLYSTLHERKPNTVFHTVVVMLKCVSSIIWRINVYTFCSSFKVFFKGAKREKIVAMDEHIARPRFPIWESAGFDFPKTIFRGVKKQTRLNGKRLILLANPRQFQFIYLVLCH